MHPVENKLTCLVFRTNLRTPEDVEKVSEILNNHEGIVDWSVDLEDWEKVLRVEGMNLDASAIRKALFEKDVMIQEMPTE